jgi:ankyrin repeat protein
MKILTHVFDLFERTGNVDLYAGDSGRMDDEQRIRLHHPFYSYAAAHWQLHVLRSCAANFPQESVNSALLKFFTDKRRAKAWLKLHWSKSEKASKGVTPLHVAARFGLTEFARHLRPEKSNVDAVDVFGRTPLWWAANCGHADTIIFLVQVGANPDVIEKFRGLRPLHEAASRNHAEAARALLEAGVDPLTPKTRENPWRRGGNARKTTGHTPLMV